jgi:hypothetical protein
MRRVETLPCLRRRKSLSPRGPREPP